MYKLIFQIFGLVVDLFLTMKLATFALLLADKSSDTAVLGALGILLLVVLVNASIIRYLFSKKFLNPKSKQETT